MAIELSDLSSVNKTIVMTISTINKSRLRTSLTFREGERGILKMTKKKV